MEVITLVAVGGTIDKDYGVGAGVHLDMLIGPSYAYDVLRTNTTDSVQFDVRQVVGKDSLDMQDVDWARVADVCSSVMSQRIIVTHGTDTMVATGLAIENAIAGQDKTVVMTGALRPGAMKDTDADFQLGLALGAALLQPAGVWVALNGIYPVSGCYKDSETGMFLAK